MTLFPIVILGGIAIYLGLKWIARSLIVWATKVGQAIQKEGE